MGEIIVFFLFGPALVMGGYFIQTQIFPDMRAFMLSLPFGFFTTAILYSNEIPDFQEDIKVGKLTWVSIVGQRRGFILYYGLMFLGFLSVGYVLSGLFAAAKALADVYACLREHGSSEPMRERMMDFSEFVKVVGLDEKYKLDERFRP